MKKTYFGTLNPLELYGLGYDQTDKLLFDKGLMVESYSENIAPSYSTEKLGVMTAKIGISKKNLEYKYTAKLANMTFDFILEHYKAGVGGDNILFNRHFEDETYGLSKIEKRRIGLDYFNKYFNLAKGDIQIGLEYNPEKEVVSEKRFKTLFRIRESFKYRLQGYNSLVLPYLFGYLDYFNREVFESTPFLVDMFKFENNLSILISLNTKFKFEEDSIFTPKTIAQNIYEEYSKEFHSLKQLEFIELLLSNENNKIHSYIVSLFFFFKKDLQYKVPSAKVFQKLINKNFNLTIGGIKLSDSKNLEHLKRLKSIKEVWTKFD